MKFFANFKKNYFLKTLLFFSAILFAGKLFFCLTLYASENILIIDSCKKTYNIEKFTYVYVDKENRYGFNEIKREKFERNGNKSINYGFTNFAYWFKVNILPRCNNTKWILEIAYPPLDNISVYLNNKNIFKGGDVYPFNLRNIKTVNYSCYLPFVKNKINKLFIFVKTTSSMQLPVKIYPEKLFFQTIYDDNIIIGVYIGILLVMIFYNFFIYISVKDKTYLIYILYVFSCLYFYLTIHGFTFKYFFPENIVYNNVSLPFAVNSITFWGIMFGIIFLNLREQSKLLYLILLVTGVIVCVLLFLSSFLKYSVVIRVSAAFSLISAIFLLSSGLYCLYKGYKPALYYVLGWLILLIGGVILVMNKFGFLPQNIFTNNVLQIGSVIEVIFLSFSLGERIKALQEDKKKAEMEILRNKALMTESFERFVPHQFLNFLEKESMVDICLGDAVEKEMTIMFNDIRNFTDFSEKINLKDNFAFLNSYFKNINPIIHKNNGFIDKFIGDSIMALFPGSSDCAVSAAVETQLLLKDYNEFRKQTLRKEINIGIGLNFGKIMLGTVGSEKRLSTTVIGDAVNLSSRIEALTKIFKVKILISEYVYENLNATEKFDIREIDKVRVKGRREPVKIYEVFNNDSNRLKEKKLDYFEKFKSALNFYRKGEFDISLRIFQKIFENSPKDYVVRLYVLRCKNFILNAPDNWTGITELSHLNL